ncbi:MULTISPECIES: glycosyltransferase family 4 protein [unclassified Empedobacter]|uniref:glycosyltransferase family 4 protein n=1 Tax=unclassified Empedobacter TaxID=2643773 RepID=UPI0025BA87A7|nr:MULTISPECIES: glycosyltransferase family 4 protein [unclassified Empedobacter]
MQNKKVLHIVTISFVIKHFFGQQFNYLNKKTGNNYHLACSESLELKQWSKEFGYTPFSVEITRSINPLKDLVAIYKLIKYIRKEKFGYVVAHTPKGGMVGMLAAFIANVPHRIYYRHGIAYETSKGIKRTILKNIERLSGGLAHQVVNVSYGVENIALKDRLNTSRKNLILRKGTCNGIDALNRFNPENYDINQIQALKSKLKIKEEDFIVGYVGRIVHDKGIDDLINAWKNIKQNKNIKLLLVGPFEEKDSVTAETKNTILNDPNIIFTDYVPDASIYFKLMDVFILATYREGFPTVSLEASSMQLPVIITKATGCEEAIKENITGTFIENTSESIEESILKYYNDRDLVRYHGEEGRKFVLNDFEQKLIWDTINIKLGY